MARESGNAPFGRSPATLADAFDASTSKLSSPPKSRPGLFIVSGVRLYREGLVRCLSRQSSVTVIGAADTSLAAISGMIDHKPDIVILDVGGPGSFEFARSVNLRLPGAKIIAFAVSDVEHELLACAAAGFAGYVARNGSEDDLISAVANAMRGELQVTPRMASLLFRQVAALSTGRPASSEPSPLTPRERQILTLVEQGMSNKEIAREVRIGSATVKNHVHSILGKLQVRRRGEAAARLRMSRISDAPGWHRATF
jgi:DNA-binding NarL/FixJ family response regulator